jgi:hypothetical protein
MIFKELMDIRNYLIHAYKKCLIYDGFTFRVDRILKNNDISWRCTNNKSKCKARVRTDGESKVVMSAYMRHFFFLFVSDTITSILVKTLSHFNLKLLILWTQLIVFSAGSEINKYMYIILTLITYTCMQMCPISLSKHTNLSFIYKMYKISQLIYFSL